jgi:hypothetical protein
MCDCYFHTVRLDGSVHGDGNGVVRSLPVEVMFELSPDTTMGRVRGKHFFWAVMVRDQPPQQWILMSKQRQEDFRARILPSKARVVAVAADAILGCKHGLKAPDLRLVCESAVVRSARGDALLPLSSVTLRDVGSLAPSPLLLGQCFRCAGPSEPVRNAPTPIAVPAPTRDNKRVRLCANVTDSASRVGAPEQSPFEERIRAICQEFPTWNSDVVLNLLRLGATPELSAVNSATKVDGRTWCNCSFKQPTGLLVSDIVLPLSAMVRAYPATVKRLTSRTAAC